MSDENQKEEGVIEDTLSNLIDPLILEIYLYKNNYVDRLLISELKKKAHTVSIPGMDSSSFFVKIDDVEDILHDKFKKDLKNFDATPYNGLKQSVTSVYFLDSIIKTFTKIKYFRVNISDSEIYTRQTKDNISFDYRIIHSRIDFSDVCPEDILIEFKRIFRHLGYLKNDSFDKTPYLEVDVKNFLTSLRNYKSTVEPETEEFFLICDLELIFGTKLERDESVALLIIEK